MSSPVFTTAVTSAAGTARTSPRRNFPAPTPPASATTFTSAERSSLPPWRPRRRTPCAARWRVPSRGRRVSVAEAAELMAARGATSNVWRRSRAHLRDLGSGDRVTYSRKVFIPLTMLCRDHCHYCTFAKPPAKLDAPFLAPEEVLAIARGGRERACKEALFTLGDRPEERYEVARGGSPLAGTARRSSTCARSAISVIEETGLLPHLNPGVMTLRGTRAAAARQRIDGADAGDVVGPPLPSGVAPHFGSPDKRPGRAAADDRGRRPPRDPVHHRHPRRDRRGLRGSAPSRCSRSATSTAGTGTSRR